MTAYRVSYRRPTIQENVSRRGIEVGIVIEWDSDRGREWERGRDGESGI